MSTGMGRYWCDVCGRGVDGYHGKTCLVCMERGRGEGSGTLKTPEESVADRKAVADAVKLSRKAHEVRGQKTMSEQIAEMKESIVAQIKQEYDLVPKGSVKEVVAEAVSTKTKK